MAVTGYVNTFDARVLVEVDPDAAHSVHGSVYNSGVEFARGSAVDTDPVAAETSGGARDAANSTFGSGMHPIAEAGAGPRIENPFRSIITLSELITIALVSLRWVPLDYWTICKFLAG